MRWGWLALCVGALTACSSVPPTGGDERTQIRALAQRADHPAFSLTGRFVVKGPDESASASLDWLHSDERDELQINGPLGKILAQLTRDAGGVKLVDDRQRVSEAATLDELARDVFGASLPLTRVAYWVTGRAGRADIASRDAAGRIGTMWEQGWRVEFVEYEDGAADALPRQIEASNGQYSFRLRIDDWFPLP